MSAMPNLDPGTIVARASCHGCGGAVNVKLNKNGNAYFNCPHVNTETLERCNCSQRWGKPASQQMQRDYLAARQAQKKEAPKNDRHTPADDRPADTRADVQEQPEPAGDAGDEWATAFDG